MKQNSTVLGDRTRKILRDSFTCRDNHTYDIGRILWAVSVISYIGLGIYSIYKNQQWSAAEYGMGLSALLAGGGFGIAVKRRSEPTRECDNDEHV